MPQRLLMLIARDVPRDLICTRHAGTRQRQIPIRNQVNLARTYVRQFLRWS